MTTYGDGSPRHELAECPMCENSDYHERSPDGMLSCALCNTSWGGTRVNTGSRSDLEAKLRKNLGRGSGHL